MKLDLTYKEILQFQYILPVQGSLSTLKLVKSIIDKIKIDTNDESDKTIEFEQIESELLYNSIMFLDSQQKLNFQSLSLINKILENYDKGDKS